MDIVRLMLVATGLLALLATNATLDATTHHAEDTQTTTLVEVLDQTGSMLTRPSSTTSTREATLRTQTHSQDNEIQPAK